MITTSQKWKDWVNEYCTFHIKATMYDTNSVGKNLTDEDFMLGSVSFTDAMSGMSEIKLGACDTNSFHATLNNYDGKFDDWKWEKIAVSYGIIDEGVSALAGEALAGESVVGANASEIWIDRGFYYIDRPKNVGNTIKIDCYDTMDKLNKAFSGLSDTLTYPIQSNSLITSLANYCGITRIGNNLSAFSIDEFEFDETTSCRQVLSWILETLGAYARINQSYQFTNLECSKWTIGEWGESDTMNGGAYSAITPWNDYRNQTNLFNKNLRSNQLWISLATGSTTSHSNGFCSDFIEVERFQTYYMSLAPADELIYLYDSSKAYLGSAIYVSQNKFDISYISSNATVKYIRFNGLTADVDSYELYAPGSWFYGGVFDPWDGYDVDVDGGLFFDGQQPYDIERVTGITIAMDDVEITGVRAFSNDGTVNDLAGTDGYVLNISNNPLVTTSNTSTVATRAYGDVTGLKVRPFEAYIYGDPSMEAGDVVFIQDVRGNYYLSVITAMEYKLNGTTRVGCYALTPQENFNQNQ